MKNILSILKEYGDLLEDVSFNAVARHPLADEFELLEKLNMTPDDCSSCDVLWVFEDGIVFTSFFSTIDTIKKSHVIYRFDEEARNGGQHFSVATMQFPLRKIHIENGLKYLSKWLKDEKNNIRKMKPPEFVKITTEDICL